MTDSKRKRRRSESDLQFEATKPLPVSQIEKLHGETLCTFRMEADVKVFNTYANSFLKWYCSKPNWAVSDDVISPLLVPASHMSRALLHEIRRPALAGAAFPSLTITRLLTSAAMRPLYREHRDSWLGLLVRSDIPDKLEFAISVVPEGPIFMILHAIRDWWPIILKAPHLKDSRMEEQRCEYINDCKRLADRYGFDVSLVFPRLRQFSPVPTRQSLSEEERYATELKRFSEAWPWTTTHRDVSRRVLRDLALRRPFAWLMHNTSHLLVTQPELKREVFHRLKDMAVLGWSSFPFTVLLHPSARSLVMDAFAKALDLGSKAAWKSICSLAPLEVLTHAWTMSPSFMVKSQDIEKKLAQADQNMQAMTVTLPTNQKLPECWCPAVMLHPDSLMRFAFRKDAGFEDEGMGSDQTKRNEALRILNRGREVLPHIDDHKEVCIYLSQWYQKLREMKPDFAYTISKAWIIDNHDNPSTYSHLSLSDEFRSLYWSACLKLPNCTDCSTINRCVEYTVFGWTEEVQKSVVESMFEAPHWEELIQAHMKFRC